MPMLKEMIARWGAIIINPRTALLRVLDGERGGLRDLFTLLVMQLLAVHFPQLVRLYLFARQVDSRTGLNLLLALLGSVMLMPLAAVLLAQLIMGWFVRPPHSREHNFDLAALSYLPVIFMQTLVSLLSIAGAAQLMHRAAGIIMVLSMGWFVVLLTLSIRLARTPKSSRSEP